MHTMIVIYKYIKFHLFSNHTHCLRMRPKMAMRGGKVLFGRIAQGLHIWCPFSTIHHPHQGPCPGRWIPYEWSRHYQSQQKQLGEALSRVFANHTLVLSSYKWLQWVSLPESRFWIWPCILFDVWFSNVSSDSDDCNMSRSNRHCKSEDTHVHCYCHSLSTASY